MRTGKVSDQLDTVGDKDLKSLLFISDVSEHCSLIRMIEGDIRLGVQFFYQHLSYADRDGSCGEL